MNQAMGQTAKNSKRASSSIGSPIDADILMNESRFDQPYSIGSPTDAEIPAKKSRLDQPSTSTGGSTNSTGEACNTFDMRSLNAIVKNLEMPSGGLKHNIHGPEFQLGMLMLVLWRAYIHEYYEFGLATELEEAEKFDDIVFQSRRNDREEWSLRFIQAKHKEGETISLVDRANLLAEDDKDFALQKYFHSFIKIQRRCLQKSLYCPFSKAEIRDVLLVTNTDLKKELKTNFEIDKDNNMTNDELLGLGPMPNTVKYKISLKESESLIRDLIPILHRTSEFNQLVHTLAKSIVKKEQLNKNITVIIEFIHPLRRHVFSCEKKNGKGVLKFSKEFFHTNDSSELSKFREALAKEIAFLETCWKFKVGKTFGNSSISLSDEMLQKLAQQLAQAIKNDSVLQIKDDPGVQNILFEHVINSETSKFYSKFIKAKDDKMLKLRNFLKRETGKTNEQLGSVKLKISSMPANPCILWGIADAFASQLQFKAEKIPLLEELLPAELRTYETDLAKAVLDVKNCGKLFDNFKFGNTNNDPKLDINEFRRILMDKIVSTKEMENAESLLKNVEIEVSEGLAKCMQFYANPTILDPVQFARQFVGILPSSDSHTDVKIDGKTLEKTLKLTPDAMKIFSQNICVLGKSNVFVQKFKKIRLSTNFSESTMLLGNLGEFREKLIALLGKDKFDMIFKFNFDIRIQSFEYEREECVFQTLPQPISESQFFEFLNKFRLIVNYPNRHELMSTIQREMEAKFFNLNSRVLKALLHEQLGNWMSERLGTFYTHEKAGKLFKEIDEETLNWSMDGVSKAYFSSTPKFSYESCANELEDFLTTNRHRVLNIIVKEGLILGRTRVVDSFLKLQKRGGECFRRFLHKFGSLFFESNKLRDSYFNDDVLQCLGHPTLWNLLVIECDNIDEVYGRLLKLLTKVPLTCKIVTISRNTKFNELIDSIAIEVSTEMSQLAEDSQYTLLSKEVLLQERRVKLGQLVDRDFRHIVDDSVLAKLIGDHPVRIGTALQFSHGYNKSFYIQRRLVEKLSDDIKLKATEDQLIEMCSPDSVDEEKCVFISNDEGMGKTTFLCSLSDQLKENYPQFWVIRIDLNIYTPYFLLEKNNRKTEKKEAMLHLDDDGSSSIEYLLGLLQSCEQSKLNTDFEKNLFLSCLHQSMGLKCILLFDAFDEICPTYGDIVRDLLLGLQQTQVHRIFITTRSWAITEWLDDFGGAPIQKLRRLTYSNQISFLITFWEDRILTMMYAEKLNLPEDWVKRLELYAEAVIDKYSSTTYNSMTGVPLHLQLLAEYFEKYDVESDLNRQTNNEEPKWQGCVEFLCSPNDHPTLPAVLDVFDLIKGFVRKKFKIFQEEKMRLIMSNVKVQQKTEDWFEVFANEHRLLALFAIVPPERELAIFAIMGEQRKVLSEIQKCIELVRVRRTRHGIIDQLVDEKPHFIQRTFAEYFFVDCIGSVLLKHPSEQHQALFKALLESIFEEFDFYFIWNLFERWLERNAHSIPEATRREFGRFIVSQWKENNSSKFLVAPIENNLVNTVKLICDSIKEFDSDSLEGIVNNEEILKCTIAPGRTDLQHGPDLRDVLFKYGCINARKMEMIVLTLEADSDAEDTGDDSDTNEDEDSDTDEGDSSADDDDDSVADDDDDGDLKPNFTNKIRKGWMKWKNIKHAKS